MMSMIKTELYKLFSFGKFRKHLIFLSVFNLAIITLILAFANDLLALANEKPSEDLTVLLSRTLANPFALSLLMIFMYISAVSFMYMDFANGYVKNIAGQVKSKGHYVAAKLVAVSVNNFIFFIAGSLTYILAAVLTGKLKVDGDIVGGVATMLLEWLLSIALCAILLFLSVGLRNNTLSVIVAVVLSIGALDLVYSGINYGIHEVLKIDNFDITHYSPSSLFNTVDAIKGDFVLNAIAVSIVFIALFLYLTVYVFKKRDIH